MSQLMTQSKAIESALIQGDLSGLSPDQRLSYYKQVCESLNLNQLTKPFDYIKLNNKLVLYAKRDATDQLRKIHKVSIKITGREIINGVYVVTAQARMPDGREDESTGAVAIENIKGEGLANAYLKSETKAKRRVTLSICGLGLLDETEVNDIVDAKPEQKYNEPLFLNEPDLFPADYVIPFGKWKSQKLASVDIYELNGYLEYIEKSAAEKGKSISGQVQEFITIAQDYLSSKEFSRENGKTGPRS